MDILDRIGALPPSVWCQAFFLGASAGILVLQNLPDDARGTLLNYGARRPEDRDKENRSIKEHEKRPNGGSRDKGSSTRSSALMQIASVASAAKVPHSWFWHFYLVSIAWSAFWAWQYVRRGAIMGSLAQAQVRSGPSASCMELGRVFFAWLMMALQGTRRLYECFFVVKPGRSPMLFAHWALGIAFYTAMSISVWIHGSGTSLLRLRQAVVYRVSVTDTAAKLPFSSRGRQPFPPPFSRCSKRGFPSPLPSSWARG